MKKADNNYCIVIELFQVNRNVSGLMKIQFDIIFQTQRLTLLGHLCNIRIIIELQRVQVSTYFDFIAIFASRNQTAAKSIKIAVFFLQIETYLNSFLERKITFYSKNPFKVSFKSKISSYGNNYLNECISLCSMIVSFSSLSQKCLFAKRNSQQQKSSCAAHLNRKIKLERRGKIFENCIFFDNSLFVEIDERKI